MIRLDRVWKIFPNTKGTPAVKDLSLQIGQGELCVFLGPSGCGKTTSLRLINRLIPFTRGSIHVSGTDITRVDPNELRRGIGYAIQNIGLFPHLTVAENISTVPRLRKWPRTRQRDRAAELLHLVGMDPALYLDRYPSELSGGQAQRVGVARCLGADPPILLMDEPFGAIDPITRSRLQDQFLKIQQKLRKTIVFVTHDIHEAIKMGDRIALMRMGELVQFADPATLLRQPKDDFVRNFVGADRALKGLRLLRVRDVMREPPIAARDGEEPAALLARMEKGRHRWCMLSDGADRFLGWLSVEDVRAGRPLRETATPATALAGPATPVDEALSMMLSSDLGVLPVIDGERLVGVVTFESIRVALSDEAQEEVGTEGRG